MFNKTKEILKGLGLTNGEIDTFLISLRIGPSTVLDLANATKLTRQSIYNATEKLISLGLMKTCTEDSKQTKMYYSESPRKLMSLVSQRRNDLEYIMKDLQSAVSALEMELAGDKPAASMSEGNEALAVAMQEIGGSSSHGYEMVDFAALQQVLTATEFDVLHKLVESSECKLTGLYAACPPSVAGIVQNVYHLPEEDGDFKSVIAVFDSKIVMVSFRVRPFTIVIDDENLAKSMGLLFKYSKKYLQSKASRKDVYKNFDKMTSDTNS